MLWACQADTDPVPPDFLTTFSHWWHGLFPGSTFNPFWPAAGVDAGLSCGCGRQARTTDLHPGPREQGRTEYLVRSTLQASRAWGTSGLGSLRRSAKVRLADGVPVPKPFRLWISIDPFDFQIPGLRICRRWHPPTYPRMIPTTRTRFCQSTPFNHEDTGRFTPAESTLFRYP